MTREQVLQLMQRMIDRQTESLDNEDLPIENRCFREGVKNAYFHAIEWIKEMDQADD